MASSQVADALWSLRGVVTNDLPVLILCTKRSGSLIVGTIAGFDRVVRFPRFDIITHVIELRGSRERRGIGIELQVLGLETSQRQ